MLDKELLKHLEYSECDCEIDYREDLKVFNGVCPIHLKSVLLVDGVPVKIHMERVRARLKNVAPKDNTIV